MNKSQIYYVKWKTRQKRLHTIKSTLNFRNDRNIVIVRRSMDILGWKMAKENCQWGIRELPRVMGIYSRILLCIHTCIYRHAILHVKISYLLTDSLLFWSMHITKNVIHL